MLITPRLNKYLWLYSWVNIYPSRDEVGFTMDRKCFDILPNLMALKALALIGDVRTDFELPLLGYCYHGLKERLPLIF